METVNIHDAKTRLSQLVSAVESGMQPEIIIARNGRPAARLVPIEAAVRRPVRLGLARGKFRLPDDFDADNEYIAALMTGAAKS